MNALWGAGQMMFNKVLVVTSDETDIFSPQSVLSAIIKNVTCTSHFNLQKGPADVLDHAAEKFTFGGKICFDATIKLPEEQMDSSEIQVLYPDVIRKKIGELIQFTSANFELLQTNYGIVVLSIEKKENSINEIVKNIEDSELPGLRYLIIVDKHVKTDNLSYITWLVLANIDPIRDCYVTKNNASFCMIIDGTNKAVSNVLNKPWPEIIRSDKKTIESIDKKWQSLGIGKFIESPSKNY
jgi:4-hydroxy-3-polyprenylbenzoate decarboxylase